MVGSARDSQTMADTDNVNIGSHESLHEDPNYPLISKPIQYEQIEE